MTLLMNRRIGSVGAWLVRTERIRLVISTDGCVILTIIVDALCAGLHINAIEIPVLRVIFAKGAFRFCGYCGADGKEYGTAHKKNSDLFHDC